MDHALGRRAQGPRCVALVGPYLSGKTTLLEAILFRTGAIERQGRVSQRSTVGDAAAEARAHGMSVELNTAFTDFLGDTYTFLDCPGSIEFMQDAHAALAGCDAAVVVCEPDEKKVPALQLILKELDRLKVPRILFINKIDKSENRLLDLLAYLQPASSTPLVLRQIPIWNNGIATGFVDLALERAFVYREHAASEVIEIPADMKEPGKEARFAMLEKLADYDDELMEQLLSDMEPPRDRVFNDLARELRDGLITPVLFGSAENGHGILRLLKALRHETPSIEDTAKRLGAVANGVTVVQSLKTYPYGTWRQAHARPGACGCSQRRPDALWPQRPGSAGGRTVSDHWRGTTQDHKCTDRRHGRARQNGRDVHRRDVVQRQGVGKTSGCARGQFAGVRLGNRGG